MKRVTTGRAAIVDAALACMAEHGWEATSMQTVRERAGVSNGTLFHHFPSRQRLASAVLAAGLAGHQDALLGVLRTGGRADDVVRGTVLRHLRWIEVNRPLARLLLATPTEVLRAELDAPALAANRDFFAAIDDWLRRQGWSGTPELPVLLALWIGPAQEYARGLLTAPHPPAGPAAQALADGAWHALSPLLQQETPEEGAGDPITVATSAAILAADLLDALEVAR